LISPFLSIVIPTFNSGKTLRATLESISSQTLQDIEAIIVDGASTDTSVEIGKEFSVKYPFIKSISEKDKGIYDAMNKGISMANGEWLLFLGSDDTLFDNNVLDRVALKIKENNSYKFFYGNVKVNSNFGSSQDVIYDGEFSIEKLLLKNIPHQAIFYHKDIFNEVGYYNINYPICADYDFNLKVASRFKLCYLDEVVSIFSAAGISTTNMFVRNMDELAIKYELYSKHNLISYDDLKIQLTESIDSCTFARFNSFKNICRQFNLPVNFSFQFFKRKILSKVGLQKRLLKY